ncbi:hypothetical protein Gotur_010680, partial [Gossypium turneri]
MQIIKKDVESSIIRSSIDYNIDAKLQELTSQATTKPMEIWKEGICKSLSNRNGIPLS